MRREEKALATRRRAHWAAAGVLSIAAVVLIIGMVVMIIPFVVQ